MLTTNNPRSILKISELNAEVALLLQSGFSLLWVEGEISNLSRPSSGHLYFSLKDSKAQVRCAMFRNQNIRLRIKPDNGMKVLARVRVGLYEPRGDFQLIVEHMEDAGAGQLQQAFDALKKKLDAAGLFDSSKKKALPTIPKRIGIITSPSGAAIQDVINVLNRRCPHIPILIYPVSVQGQQSAGEIVKAIQQADRDKHCDVLLLVRGGGSIEDLWSFNEEIVAQAIFAADTPIVSGVGHEIDFTIADFVSDQRAPTPSAAAELISPDRLEQTNKIIQLENRLNKTIEYEISSRKHMLSSLLHRLKQQSGLAVIQQQKQRIDDYENQLNRAFSQQLEQRKTSIRHLEQRLFAQSPLHKLKQRRSDVTNLNNRLVSNIKRKYEKQVEQLRLLSSQLNAISPLATLQRGYAIAREKQKKAAIIYSVEQIKSGEKLNVLLADGNFDCKVLSTEKSSTINGAAE